MIFSRTSLILAVSALALAGCTSDRFSSASAPQVQAPAPLTAAPAGTVTASQLPPPTQPGTTDPSSFPAAPGSEQTAGMSGVDGDAASNGDGTQLASLPQAGGEPVTAGSVAGVWSVSVAGESCRIATPQTRFGNNFRAGPLRCPAPLDGVRSWNVSGSQLTLYDGNGNPLANLASAGGSGFSGQTTSGQPISLTR